VSTKVVKRKNYFKHQEIIVRLMDLWHICSK